MPISDASNVACVLYVFLKPSADFPTTACTLDGSFCFAGSNSCGGYYGRHFRGKLDIPLETFADARNVFSLVPGDTK